MTEHERQVRDNANRYLELEDDIIKTHSISMLLQRLLDDLIDTVGGQDSERDALYFLVQQQKVVSDRLYHTFFADMIERRNSNGSSDSVGASVA